MYDITTRQAGGHVTVDLSGELDMAAADGLREVLSRAMDLPGATAVEVDLGTLEFMDSAVIGVLVGARRRAHETGRSFYLTNVTGMPARVLDVTGLLEIFTARPEHLDGRAGPAGDNPT